MNFQATLLSDETESIRFVNSAKQLEYTDFYRIGKFLTSYDYCTLA